MYILVYVCVASQRQAPNDTERSHIYNHKYTYMIPYEYVMKYPHLICQADLGEYDRISLGLRKPDMFLCQRNRLRLLRRPCLQIKYRELSGSVTPLTRCGCDAK